MKLSVTLEDQTLEVLEQAKRGIQANVKAAAIIWHGAIVDSLQGEKSGREYRVPGTDTMYRASKPGEVPAVRLGDLKRKYSFRTKGMAAEVGNPLEYAYYLEKGTNKMAARPHMIPAYNKNRERIQQALGANVI